MNIEDLIKKEMIPKTVTAWGHQHTYTPQLIEAIHGDGQCLIYFIPYGTRPDYYIIRVDSAVKKMIKDDGDEIRDFLDEIRDFLEEVIYSMIVNEFGWIYEEDCDGELIERPFPALNISCGSDWGIIS